MLLKFAIKTTDIHQIKIIFDGLFIGLINRNGRAGGGFLIIPALVLSGLEMKKVGTSLMIIAVKSLFGFLENGVPKQTGTAYIFTALAVIGIFVGVYLGRFFDGQKLKKSFGFCIVYFISYYIKRGFNF